MPYAHASTQTIVAGLTKTFAFMPTPPPDDAFAAVAKHVSPRAEPAAATASGMALVPERKKRPQLHARISIHPPAAFRSVVDDGDACSPPPTEAALSPVPGANLLHAGHTPKFARALSPLAAPESPAENRPSTPPATFVYPTTYVVVKASERKLPDLLTCEPMASGPEWDQEPMVSAPELDQDDDERALQGPLTLPTVPGDGDDDQMGLQMLNLRLAKVASERSQGYDSHGGARWNGREALSAPAEGKGPSDEWLVDGIRLKKTRMNLGAPLGQL